MNEFMNKHSGKLFALFMTIVLSTLGYVLYLAPVCGLENKFIYLLKEYGYIILFFWGMLEGEIGLVMAGLLTHTGDMHLFIAIFVAGLGGFAGDQVYFYIGRFNKKLVHKKLRSQRRKLALAHVLLKKHGWPIIFAQRYLYGLRTVIPISIGLTRYSGKMFALINLISAWFWASFTIIPTWYFGQEILIVIHWAKAHWYFAIPIAAIVAGGISYYFHKVTDKTFKDKHANRTTQSKIN
ncbi:DedA family protein [Sulfurospirillum diekertiae]|uniref:DedA domain protein n=1 Tax=Sulfurospirillum diekertiae TaxID=1854492 RepID=A0A290HUA8_9BACT|nr:DedA family protein [Sulfurospirillum diekertiae]ATB69240.1 DedA domain protein [Sulfurospirillum diekertiae]QIR76889.1 DedA family protein [Sulfurospirillum diekertiae]QIR79506.1 DedA family protein [Sulfurospirillum diekertiae]